MLKGTPRPAVRQRAITTYSKYRAAPDFAVPHKEDNDTPVQSQSERDKTVAGNEGGSGRPSVGVLLANGVPMKQIQEWLGHSDFSTTANVYAHLDYNSKLSSADAMVNGLSGALEVIS